MSNHGHVTPNPDGSLARCGGPGLCKECSQELTQLKKDPYLRCNTCHQRVTAEMDDKNHCKLIAAIERSRSEMREQIDALTAERDKLKQDLEEYKSLHEAATKLVFPGTTDTSDAYMILMRDLKKKLARYRKALLFLVTESKGFLSQANVDDHGVTNIRCLELVIRKAEEALKDTSKDSDELVEAELKRKKPKVRKSLKKSK